MSSRTAWFVQFGLGKHPRCSVEESMVLPDDKNDFMGTHIDTVESRRVRYAVVGCRSDPHRTWRLGTTMRVCSLHCKSVSSRQFRVGEPTTTTVSVHSAYALNPVLTVNEGVMYPPVSHGADIEFNRACLEKNLAVVRLNRFCVAKLNLDVLRQPGQPGFGMFPLLFSVLFLVFLFCSCSLVS